MLLDTQIQLRESLFWFLDTNAINTVAINIIIVFVVLELMVDISLAEICYQLYKHEIYFVV